MIMDNTGVSNNNENNQVREKGGLYLALELALKKENEKERMIAVLDCIKGYRNEYDATNEKPQYDGFMKCKNEIKGQVKKVQDYVSKHDFSRK